MIKSVIRSFFAAFVILIMCLPLNAATFMNKDSMPNNLITNSGSYKFFEWNDNEYYLVDTSTGKTFKAIGKMPQVENLLAILFENEKGELVAQPDNGKFDYFTGRYTYAEFQNAYFVLDTVGGNLWTLKGTVRDPIKFVLIQRKDGFLKK